MSCNNPSPTSTSTAPLTFKQIEAKILRGESVSEAEIKNLPSEELRRLRNTAFAKYGKVFQKPGLGDYFATCDWYKPNPNYKDADADKLLTAMDKQNVQTIQRQEESAKLNQSNSMNSAPQIISNANNASITNTNSGVQPIQPASNNATVSTNDEPPREAIDVALSAATKDCTHEIYQGQNPQSECKNYKFADFAECEITPANKENGMDEKWLIQVTWVQRDKSDGQWFDKAIPYKVARENGKWTSSNAILFGCFP